MLVVTLSFMLSIANTYDNKANTIGYIYGVLLPFFIFIITKKYLVSLTLRMSCRFLLLLIELLSFMIYLQFSLNSLARDFLI